MRKNEKGQVLIEALVALGAAVVIIGAITTIVVTSLNNAELANNQNRATQYAKQGIEIVRELSETNWSGAGGFTSFNGVNYCLLQESTTLTSPPPGNLPNTCRWANDIFVRQVTIYHGNDPNNNCQGSGSKVIVKVAWSDSKCDTQNNLYCHNITLTSCFANIKSQSAI